MATDLEEFQVVQHLKDVIREKTGPSEMTQKLLTVLRLLNAAEFIVRYEVRIAF